MKIFLGYHFWVNLIQPPESSEVENFKTSWDEDRLEDFPPQISHDPYNHSSLSKSDPEVIKLESILKLKIKRNEWLLANTCPQAANHCALF